MPLTDGVFVVDVMGKEIIARVSQPTSCHEGAAGDLLIGAVMVDDHQVVQFDALPVEAGVEVFRCAGFSFVLTT